MLRLTLIAAAAAALALDASATVIELKATVIESRRVAAAPKQEPTTPQDPPPPKRRLGSAAWRVRATSLYVRTAPNFTGDIVDVLWEGAVVEGREVPIGWVEVAPGRFVSQAHLAALGAPLPNAK